MGISNIKRRTRIKYSIRNKVVGTAERPRLTVFRSNKALYVQLIDDTLGFTLASASSKDSSITGGTKSEMSAAVGKLIAERAKAANIEKAVFDRNGYRFHGRVKAVADGAVENGLKF